jgi:hypothetical protein
LLEKLSITLEIPLYLFFVTDRKLPSEGTALDIVDKIIEDHLLRVIEEIRLDMRQSTNKA